MTSKEFLNLYERNEADEELIELKDSIGFTLIRRYKKDSEYGKASKKMFIRLHLAGGNKLRGGIDVVDSKKEDTGYKLEDGNKFKKKITNFWFGESEKIIFNSEENKIYFEVEKLFFTLNEFVELIIKNHLSDRLFWHRKVNFLINVSLKLIFWLSDKHFDMVDFLISSDSSRKEVSDKSEKENIEPFFKYFSITKNILFSLLLISFPLSLLLAHLIKTKIFTISNPSIILFFFLVLFSAEKFSIFLDKKIKLSFKNENFISRLWDYQFNYKFKLKI